MKWEEAMRWVNQLVYSDCNDWRLPTKEELERMTIYGGNEPAVYFSSVGFFNVQSGNYWSSSVHTKFENSICGVIMEDGYLTSRSKFEDAYIWPVHSTRL
jgi:hypothetical protein